NASHRPKHLWTDKGAGEPIVRFQGEDEHDEASFVVREIHRLIDAGDHRYGDIAVFYRTNAQSRVLEESLVRSGVPYRVLGGLKDLLELMAETTTAAADGVASALEAVLTRSGYLAELESERSIEAQGRIENLQELIGSTRDFDEQVERGDYRGLVAIGGVGVGASTDDPAAAPRGLARVQA